ncbi:flagellar hook-length control protein FliK [Vibrio natriegens]|uniref:flagellar hook-length control protein FliK n=1 Tax=Vibrio natriegens TaxID=691 RepID=UPI0008041B04|nr:flagellar hook-length control protein FliK [Vibrio natriegens]ANQ22272.1 flagellar hook-length control protein FliK [Vibrio natriegens]
MNVNLSNVAATNKTSVSEVGAKTSTEGSESKGFMETLAGVFADSLKVEVTDEKLTPEVPEATETSDNARASSVETSEAESEVEEAVVSEGQSENQSTKALLEQDNEQAEPEEQVMPSVTRESGSQEIATSNQVATKKQALSDLEHAVVETDKPEPKIAKTDEVVDLDVTRSMDEGQQLLGRIEQANQALNSVNQELERGKVLPPKTTDVLDHVGSKNAKQPEDLELVKPFEPVDGVESVKNLVAEDELKPAVIEAKNHVSDLAEEKDTSPLSSEPETTLEPNTVNIEAMAYTASAISNDEPGVMSANAVQRVSIEELEVIDTKLAQGKPLTNQESDIIDGLKTGAVIAELSDGELSQLVAFPNEVKLAILEPQTAQHNTRHQMNASTPTPQVAAQELKAAVGQVPTQVAEKAVLPAMPEGLTTATVNTAIGQTLANTEASHKAMNSALATGVLKATTDKQDKTEPQQGLAGQLQAAVSQQGVTTPQQARIDAAQQAQLPLQLTKELANDQVAEKVQMMMSKNLKNLDIRLDPPELGRMQIRMTMNSDLANVHFTVSNPQAREIIEQTLPRLREMLAQQGMQLADTSVQQQNSGQQQRGYSAEEQNKQGGFGRGFSGQTDEDFDGGVELNVNVTSPRDGISFYA